MTLVKRFCAAILPTPPHAFGALMSVPLSSGNLPVRPKVGRKPGLPPLPAPAHKPVHSDEEKRWDGRFMVHAIALILALALITGALIRASNTNEPSLTATQKSAAADIPPPPAAVTIETPDERLTGNIAHIPPPPQAVAYQAAPQTSIDNEDRKRLLSIISNY